MKFKTIGNKENPAILLIHAMFVTPDSFSALIEYLKDDYFIIMLILDGHSKDENSHFISVEDETLKIINYLDENNIENLSFILGTSLGAIIAMEVYSKANIKINKVFLDGGPFFKFGPILKSIMRRKFWNVCDNIKKDPEKSKKELDKAFPSISALMLNVCSFISKANVLNLSDACYSYNLPNLTENSQKKITFIYGTKEIARFAIPFIKKYKYSTIVKKKDLSHCEFILNYPYEYSLLLKEN